MRIVQMIVELKADSQNGVRCWIHLLSRVEERLAKVSAQLQGWRDLRSVVLVSRIVQLLAKAPTTAPSLLLLSLLSSELECAVPVT